MDAVFHMLTYGALYGLVGMSFNVLYRPTNVFNFAQGSIVVVGALTASTLLGHGLPWVVALLGGMAAGAILAVVVDFLAIEPVLKRDSLSHSWLITTLALSLVLDDLMGKIWGAEAHFVRPPAGLTLSYFVTGGNGGLTTYDLVLIFVPIVALVVLGLVYRTRGGKAVNAVAEERQGALLRGIDPVALTRWSWLLGGAVAALAGVIAGPVLFASVDLGPMLLVNGFMAVAIGGVGDNRGALVGGYLIALAEGLMASRISTDLTALGTFTLLLAVLLVRPRGIFSEPEVRRV